MSPPLEATRIASMMSGITHDLLGIEFCLAKKDVSAPDLFWRTAVVPIPGVRPVAIGLSSNNAGCAGLAGAMFSCSPEEVDAEMISDALSELTNIAAGQVKGALDLDQALGLPTLLREVALSEDPNNGAWHQALLRGGPLRLLVSISTKLSTVEEFSP